jgi:HEAT repeat protein
LLTQELRAKNPTIRTGAVVGLSFLGDARAGPLLREVAKTDDDELVAHEAKIALLQLGEPNQVDKKKSIN